MVEEVITREGFGADDVPDLLFISYKAIDHVSHIWSVNSPEMEDTLRWQDAGLGRFVRFLDDRVGQGQLRARPHRGPRRAVRSRVSGAYQVTPGQLAEDLEAAFPSATGRSVFNGRPEQPDLPGRGCHAPQRLHRGADRAVRPGVHEGAGGAGRRGGPAPAERDDRVFSAAIPIDILPTLSAFGGAPMRSRVTSLLLGVGLAAAACTSAAGSGGGASDTSAGPIGPGSPPPAASVSESRARAWQRAGTPRTMPSCGPGGVRLDRSGDVQIVAKDPNY